METQFEQAGGLCESLDMGLLTAEDDEVYEEKDSEIEGDIDEMLNEKSQRPRVVSFLGFKTLQFQSAVSN